MKDVTDITIILDRSGSMETIKNATIKAFNSFLKEQQKDDYKTNLSFVQFDNEYQKVFTQKDIKLVKKLNTETFIPRGMTALLDAIGTTIKHTKKRIKNSNKKPANVIIAIITDGYENASVAYTRKKIFKMINKCEEKDNWKFVFLAANQDAIDEGAKFGIKSNQALTYSADDMGVNDAVHAFSRNISSIKKNSYHNFCFTDEDREKQEREFSRK